MIQCLLPYGVFVPSDSDDVCEGVAYALLVDLLIFGACEFFQACTGQRWCRLAAKVAGSGRIFVLASELFSSPGKWPSCSRFCSRTVRAMARSVEIKKGVELKLFEKSDELGQELAAYVARLSDAPPQREVHSASCCQEVL